MERYIKPHPPTPSPFDGEEELSEAQRVKEKRFNPNQITYDFVFKIEFGWTP
jgi:hypothetical protein